MRKAVVILSPDVRGQQVIQRSDLGPPGKLRRDLEPLGMLVEHRIDDVGEGLVAIEQPVAPGEQIALEPALALVFAQDLDDAASARKEFIVFLRLGLPLTHRHLEHRLQAVGQGLIRPEQAEIALLGVAGHDIAQEVSQHVRVADPGAPGRGDIDRMVAKVRHVQIAQQQPAIGIRVGAHAPLAARGEIGELGPQGTVLIE
jgi:hypothetical protein